MTDFVTDINHNGDNGRNSEGAFVKLNDGRILFIYTRYNTAKYGDSSHADIVSITSADGGKTWSDWKMVVKNEALNVMSVSLLRLQDGRIAMAYLENSRKDRQLKKKLPGDPGVEDCRPFFCTSSDEGETWTEPEDVTKRPPIFMVLNNDRLVQLKSGRLVIPVAVHHVTTPVLVEGKGFPSTFTQHASAVFYLSDDSGATWREASQCCYPPQWLGTGLQEPGVVELSDGRIMAWFRTSDGFQYKAFSSDGGESWSAPEKAKEFPSPRAPLSMKTDPKTGELVAIWNDSNPRWGIKPGKHSWGRTPLVIARSKDNGASWYGHRMIESEPDHGFCYIAMLFDDDALLLAYCCGGGEDSIVLQNLRIRRMENWR